MSDGRIDLDPLIGAWREALVAAQNALGAAGRDHDFGGDELRRRSLRLADERAETVRALGALASGRYSRPRLVRLLASPVETKKLLGLPADVRACVFNVDGVLVASAAIHAEVWKEVFNQFIARRIESSGVPYPTFSRRMDYPRLVHGRSRTNAVHTFLASRGITIPEGSPDDSLDAETVNGLANRKKQMLLEQIRSQGISAFDGARLYLELAHDAHLPCAVVSGSTTTRLLLEQAHLSALIDGCVDGNTARSENLKRKPAPDMLLAACRRLSVEPEHTALFETSEDGVVAGRAGHFELVVAVDQDGHGKTLRESGADVVVSDLGEILERSLAA